MGLYDDNEAASRIGGIWDHYAAGFPVSMTPEQEHDAACYVPAPVGQDSRDHWLSVIILTTIIAVILIGAFG